MRFCTHLLHPHLLPGDVLQRKSLVVLPGLGQKRVAKSMQPSIPIDFNFITQGAHLRFQDPGLEFLVGMTGLAEYVAGTWIPWPVVPGPFLPRH